MTELKHDFLNFLYSSVIGRGDNIKMRLRCHNVNCIHTLQGGLPEHEIQSLEFKSVGFVDRHGVCQLLKKSYAY